jgi:MFS family permease
MLGLRGFDNALHALAVRNYRIYTVGNSISLIGTWLQRVSVGWLAWQLTHSTVWLGLVAVSDLAPTLFFSPLAGALADRVDRVRLLWMTQLTAMSVACLLAALTYTGAISIVSLFALTLTLGSSNAINQPARLALVPNLVERAQLGSAVAINSLVFNCARFIGPAIAGAVIARGSVALAFAINAATYFAFLAALARLRDIPKTPTGPKRHIAREAIEGYSYAIHHPGIGQMLILFALTSFSVRGFLELFPGFTDLVFGRGAQGLAWLTATVGIGAVAGGLWMVRRPGIRGLTNLIVGHTLVLSLATLLFTATSNYWIALVGLFFVGFAMISTGIAAQTLVQTAVDPEKRGRVMGLYGMLFRAGPAFNALLMGWVSSFLGLRLTVAIGAGLCLVYWAWARLRRETMEEALEIDAQHAAAE